VRDPNDLASALVKMSQDRPDALFTIADRLTAVHEKQLLEFAVKNRLPAMFEDEVFVRAGGLMAYGPDRPGMWRRAAIYVDKIIKACRSSRRAANEVRVGDQSEDGQADRVNHSAQFWLEQIE
jgi:putative ABC transport system substrate-binding protein